MEQPNEQPQKPEQFRRFEEAVKRILTVSKEDLKRAESKTPVLQRKNGNGTNPNSARISARTEKVGGAD
jgi:hypothetical protein